MGACAHDNNIAAHFLYAILGRIDDLPQIPGYTNKSP
jgi:hypothetical protein